MGTEVSVCLNHGMLLPTRYLCIPSASYVLYWDRKPITTRYSQILQLSEWGQRRDWDEDLPSCNHHMRDLENVLRCMPRVTDVWEPTMPQKKTELAILSNHRWTSFNLERPPGCTRTSIVLCIILQSSTWLGSSWVPIQRYRTVTWGYFGGYLGKWLKVVDTNLVGSKWPSGLHIYVHRLLY
jgi:hypothetical protein